MKPSTLVPLLASALSFLHPTPASAQWEQIQKFLNPASAVANNGPPEKITPVPGVVYPIGKQNYREMLQDNDLEWLVMFTTGPENCPGCVLYDDTFNQSVALLQDNKKIHFGRVNCDTEAVICSIFGAWGSRIYHFTHSNPTSDAFPGLIDHLTHIRPVPFHRPGSKPVVDASDKPEGAREKSPPPPPDAKWISEVVNEEKWRGFEEWTGLSHPFDGYLQVMFYQWWWVVAQLSRVPPMATMVVIGLFSRFITSRYTGRAYGNQRPAAPAAEAAKKKN